jgi:hypothetical protein
MNFADAVRRMLEYLGVRPRQGQGEPSESLTEALLSGDASSASGRSKSGHWRVACSCGFEREATTAWEATEIASVHVRKILGAPELNHTWTIEEPSSGPA